MAPVRLWACAAVLLSGVSAAGDAAAQAFPTRPVRYIMPLPAGSETDIFGRVLAKQLTDAWGQQVIVENRPGGGTTIATEVTAKAPPDGYVFMHAITPFGINATLYPKLSYDTLKDFACITHIGNLYGVLLAHGTVDEVIGASRLTTFNVSGEGLAELGTRLERTPGVDMVAPFGTSLHVSGRDGAALENAIAPYRESPSLAWERAEPTLEDVFIDLMSRSKDNFP